MPLKLSLPGEVPSKKNAWTRGKHGNVYLPAPMQKTIDDLILVLKGERNRLGMSEPLSGNLKIKLSFYTKKTLDLDNVTTTLLDLLQKANIVKNDKDFCQITAERLLWLDPEYRREPGVEIEINVCDHNHNA